MNSKQPKVHETFFDKFKWIFRVSINTQYLLIRKAFTSPFFYMSVLVPIILLAGLALVVPLAIMLNQIFVVGIMMFTMLFFGQILNQFKGTTYEKQMSESQIPSWLFMGNIVFITFLMSWITFGIMFFTTVGLQVTGMFNTSWFGVEFANISWLEMVSYNFLVWTTFVNIVLSIAIAFLFTKMVKKISVYSMVVFMYMIVVFFLGAALTNGQELYTASNGEQWVRWGTAHMSRYTKPLQLVIPHFYVIEIGHNSFGALQEAVEINGVNTRVFESIRHINVFSFRDWAYSMLVLSPLLWTSLITAISIAISKSHKKRGVS